MPTSAPATAAADAARCALAAIRRRAFGERAQQPLERGDVGAHPAGAVGDPGPGGTGQRAQAGLGRHELLGLGGELVEVGLERGVVVRLGERLASGDADGDPLGQLPVDGLGHRRITRVGSGRLPP